jgi:hypothetical protein
MSQSHFLRDLIDLVDRSTFRDSYGVDGSDFTCCRICEHESGAGVLRKSNWHAADCPIPKLKKRLSSRGRKATGSAA